MLVTCEEMKRAEDAAFARGVSAEALMEEAGRGIAEIVRQFHPVPGTCVVVSGKGHNAGDAFVAARHLAAWGWRICLRPAFPDSELAPLAAAKRTGLTAGDADLPARGPRIVLDGLLGIGTRGEPRGAVAEAIREINALRADGAWVLAIDLPSGLDGDTGVPASCCVQADLTVTMAFVKQGLVADSATNVVGRLALVPLQDLTAPESRWRAALAPELRGWQPPRPFDTHKGNAGRIGIVAGSPGFLGAARMCAAAAVRAGGGLITCFARRDIAETLAACAVPEVMVKAVDRYREVLEARLDVLAIGPGLGMDQAGDVLHVLREAPQPVVIDADALTILARDPAVLEHAAGPRLLTPHPGEMERLFPQNGRSRREWLEDFVTRHPVTLLLKGARTLVGAADGPRYFNTTGHPGMAGGGMGDVLTGVCAALIGQAPGRPLVQSAVLGAWVCGRAAEREISHGGGSYESLCATDVVARLGGAFADLRAGAW
jgi:yjeF C-terminal region, hydroxyethylthiazole kinase-related/yjeF N-terminal region